MRCSSSGKKEHLNSCKMGGAGYESILNKQKGGCPNCHVDNQGRLPIRDNSRTKP